jgi:hypothetical protein
VKPCTLLVHLRPLPTFDFMRVQVRVPIRRRRRLRRHRIGRCLRQPSRRSDARLFVDRAEQRREAVKKIPDRGGGVGECVRSRIGIPNGDLRLQAVDGRRVGARKLLVGILFQHHVNTNITQ